VITAACKENKKKVKVPTYAANWWLIVSYKKANNANCGPIS
jgi:hypothetical protein